MEEGLGLVHHGVPSTQNSTWPWAGAQWMTEGHTHSLKTSNFCLCASKSASKNWKVIIQFLSTFQFCYHIHLMGSGTPAFICLKIWNWRRKVWWIKAEKIQRIIRGKAIILCDQSILSSLSPTLHFLRTKVDLILGLNMIRGQIKALMLLLHPSYYFHFPTGNEPENTKFWET